MNFQQLSNLQYWSSLFGSPWSILINIIDIALVAWILYFFTKAVAGTKIMILLRGVFLFVLGQIIANFLGLATISWLINQVITYGVIAAVVIFTPEIRTGLERLGRATDLFSATPISSEEKLIQAFVKAAEYMSPRKIGALVAIQGSRTLQEYISTGIPLDADVSGELLINIFIPNTPLHDGAVIIRDNKIAVSCAIFLSQKIQGFPRNLVLGTGLQSAYLKFLMLLHLLYQRKLEVFLSLTMVSSSMIYLCRNLKRSFVRFWLLINLLKKVGISVYWEGIENEKL